MDTLRLAIDGTPLLDTRTGVGTFIAETLDHLARRPDLDIVAYGWPWGGKDALRAVAPPRVRVARLPMAGPPMRAAWKHLGLPPIELWTGRVDVVHGPNFVVPPSRAAELVTVHDLTVVRFPQFCTQDTLEFPGLLRRALDRGAWVHTVSSFVAGEVIGLLGADPDRVVTVPNGVVAVPEADPALGQTIAGSRRYVLALGTVEPRKDLPTLVNAFDALAGDHPDLRLVIAGPDGWGAGGLTGAIERARFHDRVVRLGWVSDDHRAALLRGASVLAYPSIYEGFGLPPLEAMSVGTPVVTTRAGAIPEVVGDAAVLVDPGDPDALAEALARVLDDDGFTERLRARGRGRAHAFSWARTADELAAVYRRLAGAS